MRKIILIALLALPLLIWRCASSSNITRYVVASTEVDCMGVGPQKCMMVKKGGDDNWTLFYGRIEGFDYVPGYEYVLDVREENIENPPADGSSVKYILVKQISKIAKTGEPPHVDTE